jgi:hypothetical protein
VLLVSLSLYHHLRLYTLGYTFRDWSLAAQPIEKPTSLLWISRWLDYTAKYGLSYQLSDGSMGIIFNDNTRMLLAPHKEYVGE